MTGLEAILAEIEKDARTQAEELLAQARADAQQTLEEAKAQAQKRSEAILEQAQRQADTLRERAESAALLEKRDQVLRYKQQLIREAVGQVLASLEEAPAEEYFSLVLELAGRTALPGDGVMYLGARDLARLPQDFEARLDRVSPSGKITLSPKARNIESGFVLAYGPVEMDCSFPALFQDGYEGLRDAVGQIFFSHG